MFKHRVIGKNIEVTEFIEEYVEKRLSPLEKFIDESSEINVTTNVRKYPNKQFKAEVHVHGLDHHAESTTDDLYESIDDVVEKLNSQFRKTKTQNLRRQKGLSKK